METFWDTDSQPSTERWHMVGLTGVLIMLAMYAAADARVLGSGGDDHGVHWLLGGAVLLAGIAATVGRLRGWQNRRNLLIGWPIAALLVTMSVGIAEPAVTRDLLGTVTTAFAFIGLTCPRWRSLIVLPLGAAAWLTGSGKDLHSVLVTLVAAMIMWVLVAETPAWLIARLERQSALLRTMAQTDALTRLLNRTTLYDRLSMQPGNTALVLIDLDDFKLYNDTHGHVAGDDLLAAFGNALRWSIRKEDVAFRLGGDEFLLLIAGGDRATAEQVLDRLRRRWAEVGGPVKFSAGISADQHDPLRRADQEMYAAKRSRGPASRDVRYNVSSSSPSRSVNRRFSE